MRLSVVVTALIAATLSLAILSAPAPAADKPLTVQQVLDVRGGLAQLDSWQDLDKDGKPITRPYKFSGQVRMAIAVNLDRATAVTRAFQTASIALVAQHADGGSKVPDEKMGAFQNDVTKALSQPAGIGLVRIREEDLDLASNPIPPSTLSLILPIIEPKK